jgi:hypothetical protein
LILNFFNDALSNAEIKIILGVGKVFTMLGKKLEGTHHDLLQDISQHLLGNEPVTIQLDMRSLYHCTKTYFISQTNASVMNMPRFDIACAGLFTTNSIALGICGQRLKSE